ncbi:NAD(P)-binding domain-containing protein [Streptacidiphilus melanogenes]|uniref:NAD(P)-binding domain-containing protein n=1 Tax=Streptacidiphilus melanogenes TaxID=411235 RepID=UPI0009FE78B3
MSAIGTTAVIGTGNIGGTLGRAFARAGHAVVFGSRDPAASDAAGDTAAKVATPAEAVAAADTVLLAIPAGDVEEFLRTHADALAGKAGRRRHQPPPAARPAQRGPGPGPGPDRPLRPRLQQPVLGDLRRPGLGRGAGQPLLHRLRGRGRPDGRGPDHRRRPGPHLRRARPSGSPGRGALPPGPRLRHLRPPHRHPDRARLTGRSAVRRFAR